MGWLRRLFDGIWRTARLLNFSEAHFNAGLRPGGGAASFYLFMLTFFTIVAVAALLLGFSLDDVDRWLDANGGWFEAIGSLLFRLLCALVVFLCAFAVLGGLWQRTRPKGEEERIGWGAMLFALALGYFAWFGVVG